MKIIKEIRLETESAMAMCVVRSNCYGSSLKYILELFDEAQATYPELTIKDVQIVQFGGQRYKQTLGIEFSPRVAGRSVPEGWTQISELEYTI